MMTVSESVLTAMFVLVIVFVGLFLLYLCVVLFSAIFKKAARKKEAERQSASSQQQS